MDLLQLQNNIKRDPAAYKEEFLQQQRHFVAELQVFLLKPSKEFKQFAALVSFLSQVASCYPQDLQQFPTQIANLLEQHGAILEPELRKILVQALVLLRNRNVITASSLLTLFFKLFRIKDKKLRSVLYHHIVNDIRRLNSKKRDEKVNRALQNFMYTMLQDSTKVAARKSLEVMIELFKQGVWKDSKTINVISTAIFSTDVKMVTTVINFFLNPPKSGDDEAEDKDYRYTKRDVIKRFGKGVIKKTNKKKRKLKEALADLTSKRKDQLKHRMDDRRNFNYAAIMMINDPQGYSEKVYRVLVKFTGKFETKIMLMALLSRMIASHQLVLLDFYSLMQKYLQPHQPHITNMMAITAQACHPLVTPEAIEPLLKTIAFNFVSDRRPNEAIVVGLNTIREVCLRCPLVMTEELLHDLLEYRSNRDKGIAMAAKSLLSLFRVLDPQMLPRKLRGKSDAVGQKEAFGATSATRTIDGTELLEQYKQGMLDVDLGPDEADDVSGEWVDVSSGDNSFEISFSSDDEDVDSQDEGKTKEKKTKKSRENDEGDEDEDGWETASDDPEEFLQVIEDEEKMEVDHDDDDGEEQEMSGSDDEEDEEEAEGEWVEVKDSDDDESGAESEEESGEWVSVSDSEEDSDMEDEDGEHKIDMEGTEDSHHERLEAVQILTDEDFALIEKLKKAKADGKLDEFIAKENKKKRPHDFITKLQDMRDEDIDLDDIAYVKKIKLDKEERSKLLKEHRAERMQERDENRKNKKGYVKTNDAKKKNKPYMMIKHSSRVQRKKTRSLHDQNKVKSASIKNMKTMDKSFKAKILRK